MPLSPLPLHVRPLHWRSRLVGLLRTHLTYSMVVCCLTLTSGARAEDRFVVLSYHDVKEAVESDAHAGQTAVSRDNLVAQFEWLKREGYRVVSVQDLLDAKRGKRRLPDKSVLLTFDDGYVSGYTHVFPLLKQYRYPALFALVGSWMGPNPRSRFDRPADNELLSWPQVQEMQRSGLIEIATHTYDFHHGIPANPQGNEQPAAVARQYDAGRARYENDHEYLARIDGELQRSSDDLLRRTGKRPRVMVWPYGETNELLIRAARAKGMGITMGLRDGSNTLADLPNVRRLLVAENPSIDDFARMMTTLRQGDRPLHVVHVDLDYIYDPDPAQAERNLDRLIERVRALHINTIYLQAYADPDGDGNADALYFPNRHLPVRADLFNRVAWQLQTAARVKVYAWMPVLAFRISAPDSWFVHEWREGKPQLASHIYKRLSPFNADARRVVGEIYEDLAKHAIFAGILFHDDAILSDFEDVTPQALKVARRQWKLSDNVEQLRATAATRMEWAKYKTQALIDWTDHLADIVRIYRPDLKTARNYYALPLLEPDSEEWFAQSFASAFKAYDYVAIEAMPLMEKAEHPVEWLNDVVKKISVFPDGFKKTVFELQSVDWNTRKKIPTETMVEQIKQIEKLGGVHLGYYPEDPAENHPRIDLLEPAFGLPVYP